MTDFLFLGSRITVDGDCSHEIRRHLLLGRKVMVNLDSALKSRDTILTILILPIHEHGMFLHLFVSSLISFISVL